MAFNDWSTSFYCRKYSISGNSTFDFSEDDGYFSFASSLVGNAYCCLFYLLLSGKSLYIFAGYLNGCLWAKNQSCSAQCDDAILYDPRYRYTQPTSSWIGCIALFKRCGCFRRPLYFRCTFFICGCLYASEYFSCRIS